jgi:hypothetical protein
MFQLKQQWPNLRGRIVIDHESLATRRVMIGLRLQFVLFGMHLLHVRTKPNVMLQCCKNQMSGFTA